MNGDYGEYDEMNDSEEENVSIGEHADDHESVDTEETDDNRDDRSVDEIEIIPSNKGGEKLCYEGHMYTCHRKNKNNIRWRCVKRNSKEWKCPAAVTTPLDKTTLTVIHGHSHTRDSELINRSKSMNRMKCKAKSDTTAKPSQLFAEEVYNLPNSTRERLPPENSVKRTIRNQRSKNRPPQPEKLEEIIIEGDWVMTGGAENNRFLLDDNGPLGTDHRVIIFATDENFELLANASAWYMDGNFDLAPRGFVQLYVLRVSVNGLFVTVAYALLQRKDQQTYTHFLQKIIDKCAERNIYPDPRAVYIDFEKAVLNAVRDVLGDDVKLQCCFFHLTQSTFRKVQQLKLAALYKRDETFNHFCGIIDALAFLPVKDVQPGMRLLEQAATHSTRPLLKYFDETYVTGTYRRIGKQGEGQSLKMRRVSPPFPPEVWNVHDATLNQEARTNNSTEAWNNRFEVLVGVSHPTIWKLIEKMRLEVAADSAKLAQFHRAAEKTTKRSAVEQRQIKLINLCIAYDAGNLDIFKFLAHVSSTLRFRNLSSQSPTVDVNQDE